MKKRLSKLISALIILTMVVSSTGLAFGAESGFKKTTVDKNPTVSAEQNDSAVTAPEKKTGKIKATEKTELKTVSDSKMKSMKAAEDGIVDAKTLFYSTSKKTDYYGYELAPHEYGVIPVKAANSGIMYMDATVSGGYGQFELCDSIWEDEQGYINYNSYDEAYISSGEKIGDSGMPVSAGEIYYLFIYNPSSSATIEAYANAYVYTTLSRTLYQGTSKYTLASGINRSGKVSTTYFKVKPDRTGAMTVTLNEYESGYSSTGYVTLYNSSKKAISNPVYYNSSKSDYRVYFGVKKGYTYYLKVTSCNGNSKQSKFGIKYGMTTRTERAIGYKSSAKKLYRGANYTDTLFVASTSNNTDWYKIYVSSKRKTVVNISTKGIKSGTIYVTAYRGTKKLGSVTIKDYEDLNKLELIYGTTYGKANSGTYYIKVVKGTKASGKYSIRYVQ